MNHDIFRDVRHVKAARELLRWDQTRLAEESGLSIASVRRFEAGRGQIAVAISNDIAKALERAGVVFITEPRFRDTPISIGVLLKASARPEPPNEKRTNVYKGSAPGRPVGRREAGPRKPRIGADKSDD